VAAAIARKHADAAGRDVSEFWSMLLWWPGYALNRMAATPLVSVAGDRADTDARFEREFAHQVLAVVLGTDVVLPKHLPAALAAGVRLEAIEALRSGRDASLTADERLLAAFVGQVVDGTVDDVTWGGVEQRLGTRATVEYMVFVTILWTTIRQLNALGFAEPVAGEIERILGELKVRPSVR
jgi:integral membrane sensor domain MASE1